MNTPRETRAEVFIRFAARVVLTVAAWLTIGSVLGVVTGCSVASAALGGALLTALVAISAFGVWA